MMTVTVEETGTIRAECKECGTGHGRPRGIYEQPGASGFDGSLEWAHQQAKAHNERHHDAQPEDGLQLQLFY